MNTNGRETIQTSAVTHELETQQLTPLYAVPVVSRHENWRATPGAQEHCWVLLRSEESR